jgi:hypothetical protein
MAVVKSQLNRTERTLFRVALWVAGLLIVVRLVSIAIITLLHHVR